MKVLVTGGSGFLGGHIVQELEARGHQVWIFDLKPPQYYTNAKFCKVDLTKPLMAPDYNIIYHAAGILGTHTTFKNVADTARVNILSMINVLENAKRYFNQRVINCGLIRDWVNTYMITKHTASKFCNMYKAVYGLPVIDARMTVVFGPRQTTETGKVVPTFIMNALRGEPLEIYGSGASIMNMMYVKDVVKILADLAELDNFTLLNLPCSIDLANPDGDITVKAFAKLVQHRCNSEIEIRYVPMRIGQPGDVSVDYDIKPIGQCCHLSFRSIGEGLVDTIGWYRGIV